MTLKQGCFKNGFFYFIYIPVNFWYHMSLVDQTIF